jgi:hypothetical protein
VVLAKLLRLLDSPEGRIGAQIKVVLRAQPERLDRPNLPLSGRGKRHLLPPAAGRYSFANY